MAHEPFEADGRDAAVALYAAGYVNDAMQRIEVLDTGAIGDRQYMAYRCEWRVPPEFAEAVGQPAGTTMAFQQHVFYDADDDGRITWLHLLCSGNHPVS